MARTKKIELLEVLDRVSPILPPKGPAGPFVPTTVRLPKPLLDLIEQIAEEEGYSRNEVVMHFLQFAVAAFQREKAQETPGAESRTLFLDSSADSSHRKPKK